MTVNKPLGVIILNWNGLDLLKKFIPDALKYTQSDKADLIVADNGSTDGSVEWLRREFPEVKIIAFDSNLGFAAGYNRAIKETDYTFVTLLNSDVELTPGWWEPILNFMSENPIVAATQPKILSWQDKEMFEYAGAAGGFLDNLGYPFCRGRLFDSLEKDSGQYDCAPREIVWASGACLTVRSDVYTQLGGLDSDFFAHMEEIDLCCRMINAGYLVCFIPESRVFHVGGASLPQGNPRKTYLNFRNNLLLLHKNLPKKKGRRKVFLRRFADTLAFMMCLLKGDIPNAKAILMAHRDFRKMKKNYSNFPIVDRISSQPGANKSALWQHFVCRRKIMKF